jgi:GAF domain-containing protein
VTVDQEHPGLDDPVRLDSLARTDLLDSPVEESFDRLTRLVAHSLQAPISMLTLVADDRQFFKSHCGFPEAFQSVRSTPLSYSFCKHVVSRRGVVSVADARLDPRFADNPAVQLLQGIAYAGAPVHGAGGETIGSLCAVDHVARTWTPAELDALRELAGVATDLIALRTAASATRSAVRDLTQVVRSGFAAVRLELEDLLAARAPAGLTGFDRLTATVTDSLRVAQDVPLGSVLPVDLRHTVEACACRFQGRLQAQGRSLGVRAAMPALVTVSPAEIARVLHSVIEALVEHGRGDVFVTVDPAGFLVRLRVQDESPGLPPAVLTALLARADAAGPGRDGSPSPAERAALSLGGRLVLVSTEPTTFDLLLPAG